MLCRYFMWLIHLCEGILLHEFSSLLCRKETSCHTPTFMYWFHFMPTLYFYEHLTLHEHTSPLRIYATSWPALTFMRWLYIMASLHLSCLKTTSWRTNTFMLYLHFMGTFHDCLLPPSLPITSWLYPTPVFKIYFMINLYLSEKSLLHAHLTPMCTN